MTNPLSKQKRASRALQPRIDLLEQTVRELYQRVQALEAAQHTAPAAPVSAPATPLEYAVAQAANAIGYSARPVHAKELDYWWFESPGRHTLLVLVRRRKLAKPVFNISTRTDGGVAGDELANEKIHAVLMLMETDEGFYNSTLWKLDATARQLLCSGLAAGFIREFQGRRESRYIELPVTTKAVQIIWSSDPALQANAVGPV